MSRNNVIIALTTDQVVRLAGISPGRLRYWEKTSAFLPEHAERVVSGPYSRIYTFQDLVNLRVMARLRTVHNIELAQLRQVSQYLADHTDVPWARLAVRVCDTRLEFRDPVSQKWVTAQPFGQSVLEIEFDEVSAEAEADARRAMQRQVDTHGRITRHRNVMGNQPVFAGTRIPVAAVKRLHKAGYTEADILRCYPTLTPEDIDAAARHHADEQQVA